MRFNESVVSLGGDRVSSARVEPDGDAGFIIASGGALVYKKIPAGSRQRKDDQLQRRLFPSRRRDAS